MQGISGTASVVGNQNGEHLNGDQFLQNRFRRETRAPLVQSANFTDTCFAVDGRCSTLPAQGRRAPRKTGGLYAGSGRVPTECCQSGGH